jgi:hypothetical protein
VRDDTISIPLTDDPRYAGGIVAEVVFRGVRARNDTILAPDETILDPRRNRLETFAG